MASTIFIVGKKIQCIEDILPVLLAIGTDPSIWNWHSQDGWHQKGPLYELSLLSNSKYHLTIHTFHYAI